MRLFVANVPSFLLVPDEAGGQRRSTVRVYAP